jgi:hypothetical protein
MRMEVHISIKIYALGPVWSNRIFQSDKDKILIPENGQLEWNVLTRTGEDGSESSGVGMGRIRLEFYHIVWVLSVYVEEVG